MLAAAWVTAGATVGLLIGAAITAWFALWTWTTQLMDVGLIVREAKRNAEERRRAQAAQIFTWVDTETPTNDRLPTDLGLVVRVSNSSEQPVYDLAVILPAGTERLRHLMPKEQFTFRDGDSILADDNFTVQLTFRDASGPRWRTSSEGDLSELVAPADSAGDAIDKGST